MTEQERLHVVLLALLPTDGTALSQSDLWRAAGARPAEAWSALQALVDAGKVRVVTTGSYAAVKQGDTL